MSINHPSHYDNNYDEEWTLEAPKGHIILLTFESFGIESCSNCVCDWVEVSYGSYIEKFCGSYSDRENFPGPFTSSGPTMTVRMRSDGSLSRSGFRAVWTSYPDPALVTSAAVNTINCITQAIVPSCRSCVCTLLCYWSPTGDLCTSCLDQPQHASLLLHHQQCPQGGVYSAAS